MVLLLSGFGPKNLLSGAGDMPAQVALSMAGKTQLGLLVVLAG